MLSKTITLDPGQSAEVSFTYTPEETGIYHVRVDGLHGIFECVALTRAHGRVSDEANQTNIAGVLVEIVGTTLFDTTDAGGNFHIDDTPFGVCTFRFSKDGYAIKEASIELIRGLNNPLGIIYLTPAVEVGSIRGKLEELHPATGDTTPMPNMIVNVDGHSTQADSSAYFLISNLPLKYYSTLTVEGYLPYPLYLNVIGDHDLGVVEMISEEEEFVIHLTSLQIEPMTVAVGQAISISCQAVLYIAPLNQPVTRTITLTINGIVVETKDVILTRTSEYWPASMRVYFEFTPETEGSHNVELDGLAGSFDVTPPINYLTLTTPKKVSSMLDIAQAWKDRKDQGLIVKCPLCGDAIRVSCKAKGMIDPSLWYSHVNGHWRCTAPNGIYPCISESETEYYKQNWRQWLIQGEDWWCLHDYNYPTYDAPEPGSFDLVGVNDAGFDGFNAWFDAQVGIVTPSPWLKTGAYWLMSMIAVPESEYRAFLADLNNYCRVCDTEGCNLQDITRTCPEDWHQFPLVEWHYSYMADKSAPHGAPLPITESGQVTALNPFESYFYTWYNYPDMTAKQSYPQAHDHYGSPPPFEFTWTCPFCGEELRLYIPYNAPGGEPAYLFGWHGQEDHGWQTLKELAGLCVFGGPQSFISGNDESCIRGHLYAHWGAGEITSEQVDTASAQVREELNTLCDGYSRDVWNLHPGNYVVLLRAMYREASSWGIGWCELWEIGRISF